MPLTPTEQAAADRLAALNGNRYDATTNPGGLAGEGYKINWPAGMNDAAAVAEAVARLADEADASAQVAAQAVPAAETAVLAAEDAEQSAQRAEQAAASVDGSTVPDPAPGNAGMFAQSTGSAVVWAAVRGVDAALVTSSTTLEVGKAYRITAATSVTLTLPASPVAGDAVRIIDGESISETVTHVLARNGQTIMGAAEDMTLDVSGVDFVAWFNGSDWRLF